ncbi:MAG: transaldolase family protein [Planctomycetota bacterium]
MPTGLRSLIDSGTRVWLDSVDPEEVIKNKAAGVTGCTSNPSIIADLIESGRFDDQLIQFINDGTTDDEALAWAMTDHLVSEAEKEFSGVWADTQCNDGWISFELDPLLEDADNPLSVEERSAKYVELGKKWNAGHDNRMIKVPATEAGLGALEELAAAGITLNVTLIFSERQYLAARDAVWKGRQRYGKLDEFKSVYSIFVSRVDVYTEKELPELSDGLQGQVGIINAKQIGIQNAEFWADKGLKLDQEMIFASTGTKKPELPKDFYVDALAGSDIQTNPPATNAALDEIGCTYEPTSRILPDQAILDELATKVDIQQMEDQLMAEGTAKFADPHKQLIQTIANKRTSLANA